MYRVINIYIFHLYFNEAASYLLLCQINVISSWTTFSGQNNISKIRVKNIFSADVLLGIMLHSISTT